MRQPLEDRLIHISRAKYAVEYPASFMLVASMNPCPCGYYGHPKKPCICTPHQRQQYLAKISGPLLDRIDLQIEVQPVAVDELASKQAGEPSAAIRARVVKARELQTQRFGATAGVHCNAQMTPSMIHQWAEPDAEGLRQLKHAIESMNMSSMNMSARAYDRILKVARTIADLDGSPQVRAPHIMEAISYRSLDRSNYFSL